MTSLKELQDALAAGMGLEPASALGYEADGVAMVSYATQCPFCRRISTIKMTREGFDRWQSGVHVQDAFPSMSIDDRETLISGSCGKCFDTEYRSEE